MCLIVFVRIYVRIHIRTCVQFECPRISRYCGYSNNKPPIVDGLYHRFMVIRGGGLLLLYQYYRSRKRYQSKHGSSHESPFFDAQIKRKTLQPPSSHSEATPIIAFQSDPRTTGLVFHLPSDC